MIPTPKNMRNELLSNYHEFKKIQEIMTVNLKSEISEVAGGRLMFPHQVPHVGEDGL